MRLLRQRLSKYLFVALMSVIPSWVGATTLDVMIAYTEAMQQQLERTEEEMDSLARVFVNDFNEILQNDGSATQLRLVKVFKTNYVEIPLEEVAGSSNSSGRTAIDRLKDDLDGQLEDVALARAESGADVVQLWAVSLSKGGIPHAGHTYSQLLKGTYSVAVLGSQDLAVGPYDRFSVFRGTAFHELGHAMGLHHSDGYCGNDYRTIMANCYTIPLTYNFSNQNHTHNGSPLGDEARDSISVLDDLAPVLADIEESELGSVPSKVDLVTQSGNYSAFPNLEWLPVSEADSYLVQVFDSQGLAFVSEALGSSICVNNLCNQVVSGLDQGSYRVRILPLNSAGRGEQSSELWLRVDTVDTEDAVISYEFDGNRLKLEWDDLGADYYEVRVDGNPLPATRGLSASYADFASGETLGVDLVVYRDGAFVATISQSVVVPSLVHNPAEMVFPKKSQVLVRSQEFRWQDVQADEYRLTATIQDQDVTNIVADIYTDQTTHTLNDLFGTYANSEGASDVEIELGTRVGTQWQYKSYRYPLATTYSWVDDYQGLQENIPKLAVLPVTVFDSGADERIMSVIDAGGQVLASKQLGGSESFAIVNSPAFTTSFIKTQSNNNGAVEEVLQTLKAAGNKSLPPYTAGLASYPIGNEEIATTTPVLKWVFNENAVKYQVTIRKANGDYVGGLPVQVESACVGHACEVSVTDFYQISHTGLDVDTEYRWAVTAEYVDPMLTHTTISNSRWEAFKVAVTAQPNGYQEEGVRIVESLGKNPVARSEGPLPQLAEYGAIFWGLSPVGVIGADLEPTFTWQEVENADSYMLSLRRGSDDSLVGAANVAATSCLDGVCSLESLSNWSFDYDSSYYWYVTATIKNQGQSFHYATRSLAQEFSTPAQQTDSADLELTVSVWDQRETTNGNYFSVNLRVTNSTNSAISVSDIVVDFPIPEGATPTNVRYQSGTTEWHLNRTLSPGQWRNTVFWFTADPNIPLDIEAEIITASVPDPDSTPNNNVPSEDDHIVVNIP